MIQNIDSVARQRNVFVAIALVALCTNLALGIKIIRDENKIIIVPGLSREAWISNFGVSASYLEENAAMFLPLLLDLSVDSIDWKKETVMRYISQNSESYIKSLNNYFARTKDKYKKFNLSTHFIAKSFEVDRQNLKVIASGMLISRFGTSGYDTSSASYMLLFDRVGGKLLLKEFVRIGKDTETNYEQSSKEQEEGGNL